MASLEGWGSTIELHPHICLGEGALLGVPASWTCVQGLRLSALVRSCEPNPLDSSLTPTGRSVVASAPALGAGDREFESPRPDQY